MTFSIGDTVVWSSQAQGYSTRKRGVVVAYVPPGERPSQSDFPDLYKGAGAGWGRSTESWVVRVGRKHYWPIAKNLRLANDDTCPACNGTGVKSNDD